ncbi:terminase large subunit domain-containing protein [Mycolicibacterium fortuitum]|uniref:terminase large subunit domain-containing protein n=1 Tax=Mycolicibacterium fortuitum TaxID=1766 RepID=UPI0007E98B12|nr:terminase large subunit [Mycolicibacterium fortuitum]OBB33798.1 terminase [Mycolicibacterium fortuitum]OBB47480.1 terminase [Mycolicibacterium fortuitum]OBB54947.1 terminase [Mycolicibacterium fortuitum]OBF85533.1 terminase [Mycolicibacterium fortuitum]OBG26118.1 terminase [Mycolicibacterium fortuitum]
MRAGPKRAVDDSVLPFRPRSNGSAAFAAFCERFVKVRESRRVVPLRLRAWQRELVGTVLDAEAQPRIAGWCLPRGQGKSTLVAALGVYELMTGGEGATVIVAAVDERQAGIVFNVAARMVELNTDLAARVQVFKDRLVVPSRGASFTCLPASPASLEGLDYSLAIVDEIGRVAPETWEVIALAQGKRERSTLIGIGTPGPTDDNVLTRLRAYSIDHPEDASQVYREFSAEGFEDHPTSCEHCWELANPALDDYLYRDALRALLPPKMSENHFRRARLCQFVSTNEHPFIDADTWNGLSNGQAIPDGAEVVLGVDASLKDDSTAIVVGTVAAKPHFDKLAVWEKPRDDDGWQVPILDVEQAVRDAAKRYKVREVAFDPAYFTRSALALEAEGLPMVAYAQSPVRQTVATNDLHSSALAGLFTHSGDADLTRHVLNSTVKESDKGIRLAKTSRSRNAAKIDLATALMMAHSRATWLAAQRKPRRRAVSFAA